MNAHEKDMLARLEAMSLETARTAIHTRALGAEFDSPIHQFCISWLADKDAAAKTLREQESLAISRKALLNSRVATAIATIALLTCPLPPYQFKGRKSGVERLIDLAVG
jgi:hypothetical protein